MDFNNYAVYKALEGASTFGETYAGSFLPESEGAKDFAKLDPLLKNIGKPKLTPGVPASPATGGKGALFAELRLDLEAITETAGTIARKEPGFDASFILGDDTQKANLATAQTFLKNLADPAVAAKFIARSMPEDFVQNLKDDLEAIDGKADEQEEDQQDATGDTARIRALIKEGSDLLKSLTTSVKNRFRRDPEVLAKWHTASHIQRAPRKRKDETDTPPAPPAPPVA